MKRRGKSQRGQAVIVMAMWLTGAFFALTVVGIDIGHLGTSATELQTVADIAASAGARNLLKGGSANTAKSDATRFSKVWSFFSNSSQSVPHTTLMTFHPAPRKTPSSS